jgi:small subunit ribosomal protein S20
MANTPSAAKRARQTVTRTERNRSVISAVKSSLKNARTAIAAGKKADAQTAAVKFVSTLDRAVKTGQVHKNKANRHKSAISAAVAKLA